MRHLNYNHLLYFWTVAKQGSISEATKTLHLTPQTISGQLKLLEESVGERLFERVGRGLALTEIGHLVFDYADEIFSLGEELSALMKSGELAMPTVLRVGLTNSIPKLIGMRILQPAIEGETPVRLVCYEGELESLLSKLAIHKLDLIISDCSLPAGMNVKAYNHKLGESHIGLFVKTGLVRRYSARYPHSLDGAPFLLPTSHNPIRRGLENWFESNRINPEVIAEYEDSALMKAFGEEGFGVFPSPQAIREEVEQMYKCKMLGEVETVTESYYAISPERKLKQPLVLDIIEKSRNLLLN